MIVITRGGRAGKTTELIKHCAKHGGTIVTHNTFLVKRIEKMVTDLGLEIPKPITYAEFIEARYRGRRDIPEFYIDDAEKLLQSMSHIPVTAITLTGESNG
jgi:hypothetical protein